MNHSSAENVLPKLENIFKTQLKRIIGTTSKVLPIHPIKAYREGRGTAPLVLSLGNWK
jgi:hypothetical protein